MKNKFKIALFIIIPLLILFFGVVFYYFSAFSTINNLVSSANKSYINDFQGNYLISAENYDNLLIIDKSVVNTGYVNGKNIPTIKKIGINNISFLFKSSYQVLSEASNKVIYDTGKWEILAEMQFKNGKWVVTKVSKKQC